MNSKLVLVAYSCCVAFGDIHQCAAAVPEPSAPVKSDLVVYGGTPAGVMAAVAAARNGRTVALIDFNNHVGGVVSGGLVDTDTGDRNTIGGLANEFLNRVLKHYRETYGADSKQLAACKNGLKYEPHVAEKVFDDMLKEQPGITVWKRHRLRSIAMDAGRITSLVADDLSASGTRTFSGEMFIDATYTGDLMATAKVPYRIGREGRQEYGEDLAGIGKGPKELRGIGDHRTQSYNYRVSLTSNPDNRVLFPKPAHYDPEPWRATYGSRIKRTGLEQFAGLYVNAKSKVGPNDKFDTNWCDLAGACEGYADGDWETRARIEARYRDHCLSLLYYLQNDPELPEKFRADAQNWGLPKDEFTDNGHFPFQLYVREARRMLGRYVLRERDLTQDRSKPDGVCAGSYGIDCHVVQHIMVDGKLVVEQTPHTAVNPYDIPYACLTPLEPGNLLVPVCLSTTHVAYCSLRMEPVFMMLGHAAGDAAHLALSGKTTVQKVNVPELRKLLQKEGAIVDAGYQPPVRLVWTPERPNPGEVVRFRIESGELKDPLTKVWWDVDGTGVVAAESEKAEHSFKDEKAYSVSALVQDKAGRRRLLTAEVPVGRGLVRDLTMDDFAADLFGRWNSAYPLIDLGKGVRMPDVFTGPGTHYDVVLNGKKIAARARFQPTLKAGTYQVCLGFRPAKNQATNVPLIVRHEKGVARLMIDERKETTPFPFVAIGTFRFRAGDSGYVEVQNAGTDGRVVSIGLKVGHIVGQDESNLRLPDDICLQPDWLKRVEIGR